MSGKIEFPVKYFRDLLKDAKKYIDYGYIDTDGKLKGRPEEGGLGEYIIIPSKADKLAPFGPIAFDINEVSMNLKDFKTKGLEYFKTDTALWINDNTLENGPVMIPIPDKRYKYPKFVEFVWNKLGDYNYRKLNDDEMELLYAYNVANLTAYYNTSIDPIQVIVSGKDFKLSKNLEGIYVAAVDHETLYQEKCKHNHAIIRASYDTCDVYLLCGVV